MQSRFLAAIGVLWATGLAGASLSCGGASGEGGRDLASHDAAPDALPDAAPGDADAADAGTDAGTEVGPVPGSVAGLVRESGGGPVLAQARVVLSPGDDEALTDDAGAFRFDPVAPGTYTLAASREGYRPGTPRQVTVADGQQVQVTLELDAEVADSCRTCHADTALLLADLAADPLPVPPEGVHLGEC